MLDWNKLLNSERRKPRKREASGASTAIGRTELERDYDRILFSAPVRRLSDKTQVFRLEKIDSVRTRLTHPHEVSNLARSVGTALVYHSQYRHVFKEVQDKDRLKRDVPSLLAAIGLAHDLGNPPF